MAGIAGSQASLPCRSSGMWRIQSHRLIAFSFVSVVVQRTNISGGKPDFGSMLLGQVGGLRKRTEAPNRRGNK